MQETFLATIDQNQGIIFKVCKLYRDSKEDQEDLFQEIVLQLWKAFPGFRRESKPGTWIYRIALNCAISSFRRKRISVEYTDAFPERTIPTSPPSQTENQERLFEAVKKLNEADRALIALYLEDYSHREIGELLGITENNVGVKISRIKDKLKKLLN